ncbi:helix-turn-helix transcriptional regulator [Microbacterium deminutum]|uniref:HTH luxR-type domain-containing protein n=1 Tax=Microbacterium deminutum TaxID=344164 RepID=A0ABN2R2B7_9MICO
MGAWKAPPLPTGWRTADQPPFVGRVRELDELMSMWPDVIGGSVRALFVTGEPGIGKTRLIREATTRLTELGSAPFVGSCVAEFGAPFEPLDVPLRRMLDLVRGPNARDSASQLIRQTVDPRDPHPEDRGRLISQTDRQLDPLRLASAIVELIGEAAESRPIVIVLDDLQWADETALRLLPRLIEGLAASRVLILGGVRPTEPDRPGIADEVLASLHSFEGARRIPLSPLTVEEVVEYARRRKVGPDASVRETAARLSYLTGGNPFLLREAWRYANDARTDTAGGITLPESVNDLLRARLHSIDAAQRGLLQHAAVLGMDVVPEEIAAMTGEPLGAVYEALDQAVAAGLLESAHGSTDDLRFPHAIARQALLDSIASRERPTLHARAAGMLGRRSPPPPRLTQRLAYHFSHAVSLGYRDQAIEQTDAMARLAASRGAHEEAARQFERASALCDANDRRNELLLSAAANWRLAADFARARSLAERVCASGGPRDRLRGAIEYEDSTVRPGLHGGRAVQLLQQSLDSDPDEATQPERIEALAALARATSRSEQPDEARAFAAAATEQARTIGDESLLLRVMYKGYAHSFRPQGLLEGYERVGEIWDRGTAGSPTPGAVDEWLYGVRTYRAAAAYLVGDRTALEGAEGELTVAADRFGNYWVYWRDCLIYGLNFIAGRLDEAREAYRRAAKTETRFLSDSRSNIAAQQLYMIKRELADLGSVRGVISGDESPHQHWAPGLLGIYTELGMARPAARMLTWLREHDTAAAHESGEWPAVLAFMTEAAVFLRDHDAAAQLRPLMAEYSGLNLMSGVFVSCFGAADRYLGQLDALVEIGDPGASFEAALELDTRVGSHLHAAHTRAETARWLASRGARSREALALADRVRVDASKAGWLRVVQIIDGDPRLRGRVDGLTAREIEILRLIDQGMSNREISVKLFISEHTVANHIRSTLTKTASSNRSQAVRYARDQGLV